MNNLENLKKYFEITPKEQILKDWDECKEFDNIGIKVSDFLNIMNIKQTKEELLRIYSAYLPYELEVYDEYDANFKKLFHVSLSKCTPLSLYKNSVEALHYRKFEECKPLLWSMNMLTKEEFRFIWVKETDLESIQQFVSLDWESRLSCKFSYLFWNELFRNHFNIFGLDESEYIKK
jgi:hypothetical protein